MWHRVAGMPQEMPGIFPGLENPPMAFSHAPPRPSLNTSASSCASFPVYRGISGSLPMTGSERGMCRVYRSRSNDLKKRMDL